MDSEKVKTSGANGPLASAAVSGLSGLVYN